MSDTYRIGPIKWKTKFDHTKGIWYYTADTPVGLYRIAEHAVKKTVVLDYPGGASTDVAEVRVAKKMAATDLKMRLLQILIPVPKRAS